MTETSALGFFFQFFASDERIKAVRQMIMASTTMERQVALDKLLPYQRSDFEGIFRVMDGKFKCSYSCNYHLSYFQVLVDGCC